MIPKWSGKTLTFYNSLRNNLYSVVCVYLSVKDSLYPQGKVEKWLNGYLV